MYNKVTLNKRYTKKNISFSSAILIISGHYNYSCLDMYQDHAIKECATNHLQEESLCIKFDDSLENGNRGCSDMGNKLYDFCRRQHPNRKCDFNMKNFIKATDENQPSRNISIEYLCKGTKYIK